MEHKLKDKSRRANAKKSFVKKFYARSTLATKNTKRKKVMEILEKVTSEHLPLTTEPIAEL